MKMKSLAAVLGTLAAASFLAATPALADDTSGPSMATPSDSGMPAQNGAAGTDNTGSMNSGSSAGSNSNTDTNSSDTNEEGSPDTATGDDDY